MRVDECDELRDGLIAVHIDLESINEKLKGGVSPSCKVTFLMFRKRKDHEGRSSEEPASRKIPKYVQFCTYFLEITGRRHVLV